MRTASQLFTVPILPAPWTTGATLREVISRGLCSIGFSDAAAYAARCSGLLIRRSRCFALCFAAGSASSISALKPKTIQSMTNQIFDAVRTLMAVREYQDKEIPKDALRRIVESAHLSASAANR